VTASIKKKRSPKPRALPVPESDSPYDDTPDPAPSAALLPAEMTAPDPSSAPTTDGTAAPTIVGGAPTASSEVPVPAASSE
jgi:hypothetical protein